MLKHGILGLLNYCDMTGYEIKEIFKNSLNYFWTAQTSQIYRELQNLEKQEWAKSTIVEQEGKPDKKVYHITSDGKNELLRWFAESDSGLTMRSPFLMKVFFLGERSTNENIEFFKNFKKDCQTYLENMTPIKKHIQMYEQQVNDKQKSLYWQMTASFGQKSMQMYIEWADDCIKKLEEMQ